MEVTPDPRHIELIRAANVVVGGSQIVIIDGQPISIPSRDELLAYAAAVEKAYERWADQAPESAPHGEEPLGAGGGPDFFLDVAAKPLPMRVSAMRAQGDGQEAPAVELLSAVQGARRTIILGEPGSGKSTALERLAWVAATAATQTDEGEVLTLPIMVRLAAYHPAQPSLIPLLCTAFNQHSETKLGDGSLLLLLWAKNVRFVLLLDGLNEFRREALTAGRSALRSLAANCPNAVVHLTCRTADFDANAETDPQTQVLPGAQFWSVQPLADNIRYWDDTAGESDVRTYFRRHLGEARGRRLYERLLRDDRLRSLARLPLFLWMFKETAGSGELPANRGDLLRKFVRAPRLLGRLEDLELRSRAERSLEAIAWRMAGEGVLETNEDHLYADLQAVRGPREYGLDAMRSQLQQSGLLVHLDEERWKLLHQMIQEYGAASHLVRLDDCGSRLPLLAQREWWRESCSLALWLKPQLQKPEYLCGLMGDARVDVRVRVAAAEVLAAVGDPRFVRQPCAHGLEAIEPPMVEVLGGTAVLGGADPEAYDDEQPQCEVRLDGFALGIYPVTNAEYACFLETHGYDDETLWTEGGRAWLHGEGKLDSETEEQLRTLHRRFSRDVEAWIASVRQTQAMDDATADNFRFFAANWSEDRYVEAYAEQILGERRRVPYYWHDSRFNGANQPVVGVNWYEAMAYAAWLARVTGRPYRLPSEAEWEWAARRSCRRYPWGDEWDQAICNWRGSVLNRPNPVGVYTQGATEDGLQELGGNVYEWTTSLYRPYPYIAGDGRERTDVEGLRVARGGSWYTDKDTVRCAYRNGLNPRDGGNNWGFRLARTLSS